VVDGYLNFDTKINTTGFNKGTAQISKQSSKIGGLLSTALGTAIGFGAEQVASQVVQSLIRIGNQAIELASDLDEVQNVVDTAFGDMAYKCEAFADTAIEQFGMSKLSAKQTASTYMAMAKSMGLSTDAASDMAIETAKLTGDVASFYGISTDLASIKLKSIFTGETETLKDLGVVLTEVNLKQYALAHGITKAYGEMNQAERVALRYNFTMDSLADAQGDFARTSDSWANQTRVLSERWKELLSILGGGLIRMLTPVVKFINTILQALINLANAFAKTIGKLFGLNTTVKSSAKSAIGAADAQGELASETEKAGEAAKTSLASFDKLDVLQKDSASSGSGGASAGGGAGALSFEEVKTPSVKTGVFDKLSDSLAKLQPYVDRLKDSWNNLKDAFDRFYNSKGVQFILKWLGKILGYFYTSHIIPAALMLWSGLFDTLAGVLDIVAGALTWLIGIITGDFEMAGEGMEQLVNGLSEVWKGLCEILTGVLILVLGKECVEAIDAFLTKILDWFTKTSFYTTGIKEIFQGLLDFIVGVFTLDWKKAWNGVCRIFAGIWNSFVSIVESAVNLIIRAVNWCINQLNKIHVDVPDWVEDLTGMSGFGFNIPLLNEVKMARIKVPKLASGAVIPPNAEFMAMLGDQRNGRNLEAPEDVIRQIVREESGNGNIVINAKGTMGQLIRLLKLEVEREDRRVGKSFARGGAY